VEHTIEIYRGYHGFAVPGNPPYDPALAERHRRALDGLYAATLQR
jgi:carboxymethylenebutenolidase